MGEGGVYAAHVEDGLLLVYIKETSENVCFYFMKETRENKFYFMISFLWSLYSDTIFLWCSEKWTPNNEDLLELIKRRSKVQEKNMSCERGLNFDQWKTFSENSKPMRVWLWLVYKFTENYCRLRLFSEFIQTQKRYPISFGRKRMLTWKLRVVSS